MSNCERQKCFSSSDWWETTVSTFSSWAHDIHGLEQDWVVGRVFHRVGPGIIIIIIFYPHRHDYPWR